MRKDINLNENGERLGTEVYYSSLNRYVFVIRGHFDANMVFLVDKSFSRLSNFAVESSLPNR